MSATPNIPRPLSDSRGDEDEAEARGDSLASGVYKIRRLAGATKKVLDIVRDDAEAIAKQQSDIEEETRRIVSTVQHDSRRRRAR